MTTTRMARSRYALVLLALASACLVGTSQAANSHLNRHDARHALHHNRANGAAPTCPNRRHNTPSHFILSSQIYDKYDHTSSNYRQNSFPWLTNSNGAWTWYGSDNWISGFYPALLYLLNERANLCPGSTSIDWLSRARKWTTGINPLTSHNSQGHDVGFLAYPYAEELKINPGDQNAQQGIRKFGKMLADRFSWTVGCTRSWDSNAPDFLVIMDNMMNLQLFFDAGNLDGKSEYYDYANTHANTTSINHLRADSSSYHVVDYNQYNADIIRKYTAQGYKDWSTWSRGQAWGIYGFAMMYTRTGNYHFLDVSRAMGQLFLQRLSEDPSGVPKWDFDAPEPTSKDTSAAAIASAGFLELYQAELSKGNSTGADFWKHNAITLLSTTADTYFQTSDSWDAILSDGTSNHPAGSWDTGLIYGDYYFVKAGNMLLQNGLIACPSW